MGTLISPKRVPIVTFKKPVWYHTTPSGHHIYLSLSQAERFMKEGRSVTFKARKFELERL